MRESRGSALSGALPTGQREALIPSHQIENYLQRLEDHQRPAQRGHLREADTRSIGTVHFCTLPPKCDLSSCGIIGMIWTGSKKKKRKIRNQVGADPRLYKVRE